MAGTLKFIKHILGITSYQIKRFQRNTCLNFYSSISSQTYHSISNFRKSSDMSMSTFSTIGTGYSSFKRRFSSASQTTTKTELPHIVE